MTFSPIVLQTADEVRKIVTTNDATVQGILIGVIIGLGAAVVFLYRENRTLQKEYTKALMDFSDKLVDLTKAYNEFQNIYVKNVR